MNEIKMSKWSKKNSGRVADENDYDSVIKSVDLKASIILDLLYINWTCSLSEKKHSVQVLIWH